MFHRHLGIALAVILLAGACGDDDTPADPQSYRGAEGGFSFTYPGDWERLEGLEVATEVGQTSTIEMAAVGELDPSSGNLVGATVQVDRISIQVASGDEAAFLIQEVDPIMESLAVEADGTLVSVSTTSVAGHDARVYRIDSPVRGQDLRSETTAFVVGDRFFKILCQAPVADFSATSPGCAEIGASLVVSG